MSSCFHFGPDPINTRPAAAAEEKKPEQVIRREVPYEEMTIAELQQAILDKMASNGPVTDYMKKTVDDNTHRESLLNWVKSFR